MIRLTDWWKKHRKRGNTLVDLLVAVSVLAILMGVVWSVLKPKTTLLIGWDTRRNSQAERIAYELHQFQLDTTAFPHVADIPANADDAKPICRQGVAHGTNGCVNIDDLVPTYINDIPLDPAEPCESYNGFNVYTEVNGRYAAVKPRHLGKMPGDETQGCGSSSSSSSASASSAASTSPGTITLITAITNDNGGTLVVGSVVTHLKLNAVDVSGSPAAGSLAGVEFTLAPETYVASAESVVGYSLVLSGDCDPVTGAIILGSAESKVCTFTFNDQQGTLTVQKTVINDNGGSNTPDDFSFQVNGGAVTPFEADGSNDVLVDAGTYTVTEPAVADYTSDTSACVNIAVSNGGSAACAITNNDVYVPSWAAYDPGANGVGIDPDGYAGGVYDGARYVFFSPDANGATISTAHGEVLRYDTQGSFTTKGSWSVYDPGANGVGTDPDGFEGPSFDGRYIYFSQFYNGTATNAEVLRYDTQGTFNVAGSWTTYNPSNTSGWSAARGYSHSIYDGSRYVYFAPLVNGATYHGRVLRYDTQGTFNNIASWANFDAGSNGVGIDPDGYQDVVSDGRYVYFAPHYNGSAYHGEVLRYDSQGSFNAAGSWSTYDPGANGVGVDPDGFGGALFDGRYVYFMPLYNGTAYSGEFLRYDTQGTFNSAASWTAYDPSSNGLGTSARGYVWGVYDNSRYLYFAPYENATGKHGNVLRYDKQGTFNDVASWTLFDPGANGVGTDPDGYAGAVWDGRYVYFSPDHNGTARHGEVLRYDSTRPFNSP